MKTRIVSPDAGFIQPTQRTAGPHWGVVDLFRDNSPALVVCTDCGATWDEGGTYPPACKRKITQDERRAQWGRRAAAMRERRTAMLGIVTATKAWHAARGRGAGEVPLADILHAVDALQRAEKAVDDINNQIERSTIA